MTKKTTKKTASRKQRDDRLSAVRRSALKALGIVILGAGLLLSGVVDVTFLTDWMGVDNDPPQVITDSEAPLAQFYAPEVLYWEDRIVEWAEVFKMNPNVLAIVMQIESCGDPQAVSPAGALGLMQVMPFHFDNGVNMLNPASNVAQGMTVFHECLTQFADYDLGLAMACYNGGPSVTFRATDTWAMETQAYYQWATGLWRDVTTGAEESGTLNEWLAAGGSRLCAAAADVHRASGPLALVPRDLN